jgi:hypothetical protein
MSVITFEQAAYMMQVKDLKTGKKFYILGKVTNPGIENTMAVSPVEGNGGTMFYCLKHEQVYAATHGFCEGCRLEPLAEAIE